MLTEKRARAMARWIDDNDDVGHPFVEQVGDTWHVVVKEQAVVGGPWLVTRTIATEADYRAYRTEEV